MDRVIELVASGLEPSAVEIGRAIVEHSPDFERASNEISVRVARRLVGGSLDFEPADVVMNWLWVEVTSWLLASTAHELPKPMYAIYDAVDAGEYRRPVDPPGLDAVAKYTMPTIESIVESLPPADRS